MAELSQPRVNPSDWASRRKHAMSRARELRSRIKESESSQGSSDVSSLASKSEIQRQRRSRQLEATQRLLDGQSQSGGFDFNEPSSERSVGSRSFDDVRRRQKAISDDTYDGSSDRVGRGSSMQEYNHDDQAVGRSGSHSRKDGSENHSIISQKHLGRINRRYQNPSENDSLTSKLDHNVRSDHYKSEEQDPNMRSMNESANAVGGRNKIGLTARDVVQDDTIRYTLREKPVEGRGRGRGRRKSPQGSSSLGELSRSSKSHSHSSAIAKDQMADSRSRSPSTTRINSSSKQTSQFSRANVDDSDALWRLSYLRSRRVPDYKEGECEKLAILRQRLVARRRKRQPGLQEGKENAEPETTRSSTRSSKSQYVKHVDVGGRSHSKDKSHSLERLDPNDFTAGDFQAKPEKSSNNYPMPTNQSVDHSFHSRESPRMDKSQLSISQSERGEDGVDDEVVKIELIKCDCCKRSFAPKVYEKHLDRCASNIEKKRPVFNAAKARIANNSNLNKDEQMQVLQVNKKVTKEITKKMNGKGSKKRSKKSSKWKEESNTFREAMKANRLISKAEKEGKPAHYYL